MTLTEFAQSTLPTDASGASLSKEGSPAVVATPSRIALRMRTLLELSQLIEPVKATTP